MSLSHKGKKLSEEHIKNIIIGRIKKYDEIGRKQYKRYYHMTGTKEYKKWRSDVFTRDNWTCQTCGLRGVYLEAHHIKSWAEHKKLRYDVENGVTLCVECHRLTRKKIF